MATSEKSPDCGGIPQQDPLRELRYKAEEIVRIAFRESPQHKELVEMAMTALAELEAMIASRIRE